METWRSAHRYPGCKCAPHGAKLGGTAEGTCLSSLGVGTEGFFAAREVPRKEETSMDRREPGTIPYQVSLRLLPVLYIALFGFLLPYPACLPLFMLMMLGVYPLFCGVGLGLALWSALRHGIRRGWPVAAGYLPILLGSCFAMYWCWYAAAHF